MGEQIQNMNSKLFLESAAKKGKAFKKHPVAHGEDAYCKITASPANCSGTELYNYNISCVSLKRTDSFSQVLWNTALAPTTLHVDPRWHTGGLLEFKLLSGGRLKVILGNVGKQAG